MREPDQKRRAAPLLFLTNILEVVSPERGSHPARALIVCVCKYLLGAGVGGVGRAVGAVLAVIVVGASGAAAAAEIARARAQEGDAGT